MKKQSRDEGVSKYNSYLIDAPKGGLKLIYKRRDVSVSLLAQFS